MMTTKDLGVVQKSSISERLELPEIEDTFENQGRRNDEKKWTHIRGYRYFVSSMAGLAFGLVLCLRNMISVIMVRMVDYRALFLSEHLNLTYHEYSEDLPESGGEFVWNNETQQIIMSYYMVAYAILQIPLTKLGMILGLRLSIPLYLSMSAISNLLIPIFAYIDWRWVVVLRLINGAGGSAILPLTIMVVEKWMPQSETSLGLSIGQVLIGIVVTFYPAFVGRLAELDWANGFYIPSVIALLFCLSWFLLITDLPEQSCFVSTGELTIIRGPSKELKQNQENNTDSSGSNYQASWLDIVKCPTFYIFLVVWVLHASSQGAFNFILPNYLKQFLKVDVVDNGFYVSVIQSGNIISSIWPSLVLGFFQKGFKISLTRTQHLTYSFLCLGLIICFLYMGTLHNHHLIVTFISRAFDGANHVLIPGAIMYAFGKWGATGLTFSIINAVGNFSVFILSPLIGMLLDYTNQSILGWSIVFWTFAAFHVIMLFAFLTIKAEPVKIR